MSTPKLAVELVPETAWGQNLRTKLKDKWDGLRKACYRKAGYKCEVCGGVGPKHPVEAHEVWEWNETSGVQKCVRLIALCPLCHQAKHIGLAEIQGKLEETYAHLMKVNNWTADQLHDHVDEAWEDWSRRSEMHWTLDTSNLEKELT